MYQLGEPTWTPVGAPSHEGISVLFFQPGKQGLEVVEQWSYIHILCSCDAFQC